MKLATVAASLLLLAFATPAALADGPDEPSAIGPDDLSSINDLATPTDRAEGPDDVSLVSNLTAIQRLRMKIEEAKLARELYLVLNAPATAKGAYDSAGPASASDNPSAARVSVPTPQQAADEVQLLETKDALAGLTYRQWLSSHPPEVPSVFPGRRFDHNSADVTTADRMRLLPDRPCDARGQRFGGQNCVLVWKGADTEERLEWVDPSVAWRYRLPILGADGKLY